MTSIKGLSAFVEHLHGAYKEAKTNNLGQNPYQRVLDMRKIVPKKPQENVEMKMLKIRSNFARGRVVSFGSFNVHFNNEGIAQVPESSREAVEGEMSRRPGRFSWEAEPVNVVVAPVKSAPTVERALEIEVSVAALEEEMTAVLEEVEEQSESEVKKTRKSKK